MQISRKSPLTDYLDHPILLAYAYQDGQTRRYNVMVNGAWTWYSSGDITGTIHEIANPSLTYNLAKQRNLMNVSMIFPFPNASNVKLLKRLGSVTGVVKDGPQRKLDLVLKAGAEIVNDRVIHTVWPTWCMLPVDFHAVADHFVVMTTAFEYSVNGYPNERIIDENRRFYRLEKGVI
jgi:hypothetical protein